jgi:hypothetical protein
MGRVSGKIRISMLSDRIVRSFEGKRRYGIVERWYL